MLWIDKCIRPDVETEWLESYCKPVRLPTRVLERYPIGPLCNKGTISYGIWEHGHCQVFEMAGSLDARV